MKDQPWESQPNLANRSEVVSIYKCPPKILGPSPNLGRKKHIILDHFFCNVRTRHRMSPERNVASTDKNDSFNQSIYNVSPKSIPAFRDL